MTTARASTPEDSRYRLGHDVLGPVLEAFARILLHESSKQGITHLAFVARDGEFLREVTKTVAIRQGMATATDFDYLYVSRISTALPSHARLDEAALNEALGVRAGTPNIRSTFAYFGLDCQDYLPELSRHGLVPETFANATTGLQPLLQDRQFTEKVGLERQRQRELLEAYLRQHGVLGSRQSALVDIGWRGSIPTALAVAFSGAPDYLPLRVYYLGYWHESRALSPAGFSIDGLLADIRRRRSVLEGSAHYVAFLLEAICRADHGTVLGYRRSDQGVIIPILAEETLQRQAERTGNEWRTPIRQGILDWIGSCPQPAGDFNAIETRRDAQQRLYRLAFFPTPEEISAISGLVHSEGHDALWSRPLIDASPRPPWRGIHPWLAGLASPWRSGYVMASGGRVLSQAFICLESLLIVLPPGFRRVLRKTALWLAGRT